LKIEEVMIIGRVDELIFGFGKNNDLKNPIYSCFPN
jgi:hypothetical protein